MRSCGFLATPLPISMQTQCAVCFSFFSLPVQGLYSVTVISGPALVTFSLSHLGEKMQKTTILPKMTLAAEGQRSTVLHLPMFCAQTRSAELQERGDKNMPTCGKSWQNLEDLKPLFTVRLDQSATPHRGTGQVPKHQAELVSLDRDTLTLPKEFRFAHRHSQKNLNCCFRVVSSPREETVWRAKPILGTNFN